MAALPVGTLVEVYSPPGERSWYGGRLGEGASVEGATVVEYLDGNPEREEMFLEDRLRGPGEHDGYLSRRGGGRRVAVKTVDGWSREAEKGLLMGWRRLPRGDASASADGETEGVSGENGATGVDGLAGGTASGGEEAVRMGSSPGVGLGTAAVGAEHGADAAGVGGVVEPPRPLEGVSGGASGSAQLEGVAGGRGGTANRRRDSTGARAWWATRMGLERRGGHGCED
ncbi:hypothetical protein CYMTET_52685 [Cymbomonas tetramitiformis]|uniref:Uncharacterized protein n=1 Tax=Cymbomonas tetramitiformis TaxID=36881 RepID=A0AAE0BK91_9CHLO|nr:hypothetical protein CYMTET_52685 [Cymbomonas tetramitiformis]